MNQHELNKALETGAELMKIHAKAPSAIELIHFMGESIEYRSKYTGEMVVQRCYTVAGDTDFPPEADGAPWNYRYIFDDMPDELKKRRWLQFNELMKSQRDAMTAHSFQRDAGVDVMTYTDGDEQRVLPAYMEDHIGREGKFRNKFRWGRRRTRVED